MNSQAIFHAFSKTNPSLVIFNAYVTKFKLLKENEKMTFIRVEKAESRLLAHLYDLNPNEFRNQGKNNAIREYLEKRDGRSLYEMALASNDTQAAELSRVAKQKRELVFNANLRLIKHITREYKTQNIPEMDLIQEGNIALLRGVERYNHRMGKFSTYAGIGIRRALNKAVNTNKPIQVPIQLVPKIRKILRVMEEYRVKSVEKTFQEVGQELGYNDFEIKASYNAQLLIQTFPSLHQKIGREEEGRSLEEITADPKQTDIEQELDQRKRDHGIKKAFTVLTYKEQKILEGYYGIDCDKKLLREMGVIFGLSRERIRQIRIEAEKKLKEKFGLVFKKPVLN